MNQIIEQTDEEKMTMYMKLSKKEIINMLIQCNKVIDRITPIVDLGKCSTFISEGTLTAANKCVFCGNMEYEH